jgi:hypothetical protein
VCVLLPCVATKYSHLFPYGNSKLFFFFFFVESSSLSSSCCCCFYSIYKIDKNKVTMDHWSDYRFQKQVDSAVIHVRRILENNKNPLIAGKHQHTYDDKYDVSELVTNASIASHLTFLANIGVNEEKMRTLVKWARSKTITLRLRSEEKCTFLKEGKNSSYTVIVTF